MSKTLYIGLGGLGKSTIMHYYLNENIDKKERDFLVIDYACDNVAKDVKRIEVGKIYADYEGREIRRQLRMHKSCIVVCGFGGKATSEYLPLMVKLAQEVRCNMEVYAATPFRFEGVQHRKRAIEVLRKLKSNQTSFHLFHNYRLMNHPLIEQNGIGEMFGLWVDFLHGWSKS